jgi:hypothetical protein
MTEEVVRKLETAFLMGCTDREACFSAGIGRSTLADYERNHPDFSERKQALKSNPVYQARKTVLSAIQKGDAKTSIWLLERKRRKEFGPQAKTELTVTADVKPIDLNDWAVEQDAAFMGRETLDVEKETLEDEKNCSDSSDT